MTLPHFCTAGPTVHGRPGRARGARVLAAAVVVLLAACARESPPATPAPPDTEAVEEEPVTNPTVDVDSLPAPDTLAGGDPRVDRDDVMARPGPVDDGAPGAWTEATLEELSLRQKVGQMIVPWVLGDYSPEGSAGFERITRLIDRDEIGGIIVSVGTPADVATKTNILQRRSNLPLMVAADLETGAGFRLRGAIHLPGVHDLGGATDFPSLMAVGAAGDRFMAYEMGRITALEARAAGIHVPFAPVLDVNNNPDNPIINTRSFGEDPQRVGEFGACFVRGIQEYGAVATGKHFPGHGDTETDSHLALPVIRLGADRLRAVELEPFRMAIEAGMGAIMTAHIALPELTENPDLPATLSENILTGLLREEMGFEGLIFTDAMDMNAIDRLFSREEAAVQAVMAGADVLLMPPDPEAAIRGVVGAVLQGRIPESRIDDSVRRILRQKEDLGLHVERTVDLEALHRTVGIPAHTERANQIAERSLTLLRNERDILPLLGTRTANVLSVTYRRTNDLMGGRAFDQRLRQTYPRLRSETIGQASEQPDYDRLLRSARDTDLVVVSLHVTAVSYSGSVAVPEELSRFIRQMAEERIPHVVVSFGNPYLLREFPMAQAYLLAWSGSEASQQAAARSLLGEIPITGRSPTLIPPGYEIGAGIQLGTPRTASAAMGQGCPVPTEEDR